MDDNLIGMTGRRLVRKPGASTRSRDRADFEERLIQVLGIVGASHCLIQVVGQHHSSVIEIAALKRYAWFETIADARHQSDAAPDDDEA